MRKLMIMLFVFPILFACNNQDRRTNTERDSPGELLQATDTASGDPQEKVLEEMAIEKDGATVDSATSTERKTSTPRWEGEYRRVDSEGNAGPCGCSCFEVSFDKPIELCISPENIYITSRMEKTGAASADIYFVKEVQSDALAKDIPWQDFDTTTPVAQLSLQSDNSLELDWIGFSIDGEVAVDYAIYGKKTLEGTYIKP